MHSLIGFDRDGHDHIIHTPNLEKGFPRLPLSSNDQTCFWENHLHWKSPFIFPSKKPDYFIDIQDLNQVKVNPRSGGTRLSSKNENQPKYIITRGFYRRWRLHTQELNKVRGEIEAIQYLENRNWKMGGRMATEAEGSIWRRDQETRESKAEGGG